jgi:AcrR family transcriptional regulator
MARPSKLAERRGGFTPIIAGAFAELGYRRATTAELARRCGVQETILYRIWPDKKAMFLAAIAAVFETSRRTWEGLVEGAGAGTGTARRILDYETRHQGEFGLYRIVFAGLSETDDPEIHAALREMYEQFHGFIHAQISAHRDGAGETGGPDAAMAAWAVLGLGTVVNIGRELGIMSETRRRRLMSEVGGLLLEGRSQSSEGCES